MVEEGGERVAQKGVDPGARRSGIWVRPSHLRTTFPFLDSTSALSLERRGLDLVNWPTWSLLSRRATRWLMYSDPLSAWKPKTRKGNAVTRASSTGTRKYSVILGTATSCWYWVTSSTMLMTNTPFSPSRSPEWTVSTAQEARPALGAGLAAHADGGGRGAGAADRGPGAAVGLAPAQVVDVAVRDPGQTGEALVAEDFVLASQDLLGGRAGELAEGFVHLRQQPGGGGRVDGRKGRAGGRRLRSRIPPVRRWRAMRRLSWAGEYPVTLARHLLTGPLPALDRPKWYRNLTRVRSMNA